jgi:hypothetical protein
VSSIEEVRAAMHASVLNLGRSRASMAQVSHDIEQEISALRSRCDGTNDSDLQAAIAALEAELNNITHTSAVVGKTMEEAERYAGRI